MTEQSKPRRWQDIEVARVVIEFESAFLVGSGEGDRLHDAVFCADANGLPSLPGDTIAGILRHALANGGNPATEPRCMRVFGFQEGEKGESSCVRVSWGQVHDENDRPVPFLGAVAKPPRDVFRDPLLTFLAAGVPRDHVRIGPHGAGDDRAKFDELLVPAGTRFTFEIVVDRPFAEISARELIGYLALPHVRIGGGGHHGLGQFKVVRAAAARFNLADGDQRRAYAEQLPVGLEEDAPILKDMGKPSVPQAGKDWITGTLNLVPRNTWLFGGTIPSGREPAPAQVKKDRRDGQEAAGAEPPDRFPLTERKIVWERRGNADHGRVIDTGSAPFLVPGSSLRGALRHRTIYHIQRLELIASRPAMSADEHARAWTVEAKMEKKEKEKDKKEPTDEERLFGELNDRARERSVPGAVTVGDAFVNADAAAFAAVSHVSLDRFTQGPMDGLLFDEAALYRGRIQTRIALRTGNLTRRAREAFLAALKDLCNERLLLGAARGHGGFEGSIEWSVMPENWPVVD